MRGESELGLRAKNYIQADEAVPDELTAHIAVDLLKNTRASPPCPLPARLAKLPLTHCPSSSALVCPRVRPQSCRAGAAQTGWLLDGFPRTREQAHILAEAKLQPHVMLMVDVPGRRGCLYPPPASRAPIQAA
eukprot:SAG11_NODE_73_length_18072_cov_8.670005_7_plen_133_part_00